MTGKRILILTIAGIASLLLLCGGADARVLYGKKIEKGELEKDNTVVLRGGEFSTVKGYPGWRSRYNPNVDSPQVGGKGRPEGIRIPLKGGEINPAQGTMIWWFYYDGSLPAREITYDVIFTLADDKGRRFLPLHLIPRFLDNTSESGIIFRGQIPDDQGLYGQHARFPVPVPPKRWSYVAVTWGPDPAAHNRVYLNGIPAKGYFNIDGTPTTPSSTLGKFIERARSLHVGTDIDGYDAFYHGYVGEMEVRDEILTSFNIPPRGLPAIRSVSDDSFKVTGISGKLVAGDRITVTAVVEPGGKASVDLATVKGSPLAEVPATPGTYTGTVTVPPGVYVEGAFVLVRFADDTGLEAEPVAGTNRFAIDSRSRFALSIDKTDLPADSNATARVKVKVTDANGNPVKDHQVKATLSTTDEYTGLVGGGSARYKDAAAAAKDLLAGADVETRWKGITDSWGEVEFDFKSGFAAKTIILQAKDMTSGDVGVDYITSYKEASIDIALTAPISRAAARRGLQYMIKVEATRTELTADGRSRSVIRATVSDPTGKPVAGDNVVFALSSANGTLTTIKGTTDASGVATAEYIAGKKIGIVVVTATDTVRNISASVSITLLSDAPAKILLKARPETMPADGNSRADISVKVTDINDNPNKDTKVEFRMSRGSGKMDHPDRVTDRFGDTLNRFTAGTTPGVSTIVATVRSKVPTVEELAKAQNVLFVPFSDQGEDIRIIQWLKKKGDSAMKGEPVVEYTFGRGDTKYTLNAPYDCRIDFQFVEYWDNAKTGDTLAQISPVVITGSPNTPPPAPSLSPRRR